MAFSTEVVDRGTFGNMKLIALKLTDVQDDGTSIYDTGWDTVWFCKASNNTDSADHFKETLGAHSSPSTRSKVTFTAGTNNDDGIAVIIGR